MRALLRRISDALALWSVSRSCSVDVHPTAKVAFRLVAPKRGATLRVGLRSIVQARIVFDADGASVSIGQRTFIGASTLISASSLTIGDDVLISWGCTIVDHDSHSTDWGLRKRDVEDWYSGHKDWSHVPTAPTVISNKAWIGFNCCILKGVTIGEGSVIGAGSVVTKDVPAFTLAAGNPAIAIRNLGPKSDAA